MNKIKLNIDNFVIMMPCDENGNVKMLVIHPSELNKRKLLGMVAYELMDIDTLVKEGNIKKDNIILVNNLDRGAYFSDEIKYCIQRVIKRNDFIIKNIKGYMNKDGVDNLIEEVRKGIGVHDIITTYVYRGIYSINGLGTSEKNHIIIHDSKDISVKVIEYSERRKNVLYVLFSSSGNGRENNNIGSINNEYETSRIYLIKSCKDNIKNPKAVLRLCDSIYKTCKGAFISAVRVNTFSIIHKKEEREKIVNIIEAYGFGEADYIEHI